MELRNGTTLVFPTKPSEIILAPVKTELAEQGHVKLGP